MDFTHPAALISSIIIGLIGMLLFIHGKREGSPGPLITGIVLCVFPYFVASAILMWLITGGCLGGLYYYSRSA